MEHDRDVLKAITSKDYRDKVSELLGGGWSAERTGKNHFKLSHPDAGKSVIASGTPSDFRASVNLEMQCRRALRLGQAQQEGAEGAEPPQSLLDELRGDSETRKKKRKNKTRWTDRDRENRDRRQFTAPRLTGAHAPAPLLPLKCEKPSLEVSPEKLQMSLMEKKPIQAAAGVPVSPSSEVAPAVPASPTPMPAAQLAPLSTGLTSIPGDLLTIAMRIMSGELRTIQVTPDMVGKTLVLDGDGWMVDGPVAAAPQPVAVAAPALPQPAPVETVAAPALPADPVPSPSQCDDELTLRMLEVFRTFPEEAMGTSQVMALVENKAGSSDYAHREAIRYRLANMVKAGFLNRKDVGLGKRKAFAYTLVA